MDQTGSNCPKRSDFVERRLDLIDEVLDSAFAYDQNPSQENKEEMNFFHSKALDQRIADLLNQ